MPRSRQSNNSFSHPMAQHDALHEPETTRFQREVDNYTKQVEFLRKYLPF